MKKMNNKSDCVGDMFVRHSGAVLSGVYEEIKNRIGFVDLGPDRQEDTKSTETKRFFTTNNGANGAVARTCPLKQSVMLLILFFLFSCSGSKTLATVDGEKITLRDLTTEINMEKGNYDPTLLEIEDNFNTFKMMALEKLIQEKILLKEAKRLGITAKNDEIKQIKEWATRLESQSDKLDFSIKDWESAQIRKLVIGKMIQQEVINPIPMPDTKVTAFYKSHIKDFNQPAQFHARQILVDTQETADEVKSKLGKGEKFEDLARQYSQSPDAKNGGDLGFFDTKSHPPIFSEVCIKLKPGETSDVAKTDYGYQIFTLIEKRDARQLSFEEVKDRIKNDLKEDVSEEAFKTWIDSIAAKANITTNEEAIKEVKLEKNN